jgi:hypothetical protein
MRKKKLTLQYVRAKRGDKKIHIKHPLSLNDITMCRRCTNYIPVEQNDELLCKEQDKWTKVQKQGDSDKKRLQSM